VARWNDYLTQPMVLDDAASLQALRLTGSFKLREPAIFIASLPRSLPVRCSRCPMAESPSTGADGRPAG
jgi:transmembrane sensor